MPTNLEFEVGETVWVRARINDIDPTDQYLPYHLALNFEYLVTEEGYWTHPSQMKKVKEAD